MGVVSGAACSSRFAWWCVAELMTLSSALVVHTNGWGLLFQNEVPGLDQVQPRR